MRYSKPLLPFSDQADLLISRGLVAPSKSDVIEKLKVVSYYRLSGYWFPFRIAGSNDLTPGTTLDTVWRRYTFDRQLRLLVLDAIERVEVAIRTQIVNQHTHKYGPFGYVDRLNLPGLNRSDHRGDAHLHP